MIRDGSILIWCERAGMKNQLKSQKAEDKAGEEAKDRKRKLGKADHLFKEKWSEGRLNLLIIPISKDSPPKEESESARH